MNSNHQDDIHLDVMEAFTSMHTDHEIGMPDVSQELARVKASVNARRHRHAMTRLRKTAAVAAIVIAVSGVALAAVVSHTSIASLFTDTRQPSAAPAPAPSVASPVSQSVAPADSITHPEMVSFDHATLSDIMASIGHTYGKTVIFCNDDLRPLRLHFRYSTGDTLQQVIESLNMFEKITVTINGDNLEVR